MAVACPKTHRQEKGESDSARKPDLRNEHLQLDYTHLDNSAPVFVGDHCWRGWLGERNCFQGVIEYSGHRENRVKTIHYNGPTADVKSATSKVKIFVKTISTPSLSSQDQLGEELAATRSEMLS